MPGDDRRISGSPASDFANSEASPDNASHQGCAADFPFVRTDNLDCIRQCITGREIEADE
jgi:hypothetical protein